MNLHETKEDGCFYYTYKISCLLPDKPYYYYGIHKTKKLNDGYFGGGRRLNSTVQKYGRENFKKEILQFFDDYEQLLKAEVELVGNLYKEDCWCLNLVAGGGTTDGFHTIMSEKQKQHLSKYNKEHSLFAKRNMFEDDDFRRKHREAVSSPEVRQKNVSKSHWTKKSYEPRKV